MLNAPLNILLVDDNVIDRKLIELALGKSSGLNITTLTASSLEEALNYLQEQRVDIVLIDLDLPDSTGLNTVEQLGTVLPSIPVIVLTSAAQEDIGIEAIRMGASDYLVKNNFPSDMLLRSIRHSMERKHYELELREARILAETANAAKSNFLTNISHEIRSPLTSIIGYTDLLEDIEGNTNKHLKYISTIRRNSTHLLALIDDILDISKIEANSLILNPRKCCIAAVIADVVSMLRVQATNRGLSITVEYTTEIPQTILADEMRVRQILMNLIGNSIKFTNTGGIKLVATFLPTWQKDKPGLNIEIIDTGIGISMEDIPQLYQPFVKVDLTSSETYEGTGLGLAISKRLVDLMKGNLEVDSQLGKGTSVSMTIPTGPINNVEMLTYPGESIVNENENEVSIKNVFVGTEILLAEDSPDIQRLLSAILTKAGAKVDTAKNGIIALEMAMNKTYDIILMDMQMPRKDGYEATSVLREQGYKNPIIALTAHAMIGDREKCLDCGCDDYLSKPVDRFRLIDLIMKYAANESETKIDKAKRSNNDESLKIPDTIKSKFADDSEIAALLDKFIDDLEDRIESMWTALADKRYRDLERQAHQLKGAGGLYGYQMLTDLADSLEDKIKQRDIDTCKLTLCKLNMLTPAIVQGHTQSRQTTDLSSRDTI